MASPLNIASVSCSVGRFMDNLQTEVLEIEFLSYSKGMTTISEEDFARILLRYTTVENITGYLENVRQSIPDEKVILTLDTHNHPPTNIITQEIRSLSKQAPQYQIQILCQFILPTKWKDIQTHCVLLTSWLTKWSKNILLTFPLSYENFIYESLKHPLFEMVLWTLKIKQIFNFNHFINIMGTLLSSSQ